MDEHIHKGNFCVLSEFITDDDCVYVYFKYVEELDMNNNTIKAGKYKVEIEFTLEEDVRESVIDSIFENAMYNDFNDISSSDIGRYEPVENEAEEDIKISEVAYELYKQDWIDRHTTPIIRLETLREYFKYKKECIENDFEIDSFEEWIFENCYTKDGRSIGVYACYDEFLEEEYLDGEYMELLLDDELIEMYFKDISNLMLKK